MRGVGGAEGERVLSRLLSLLPHVGLSLTILRSQLELKPKSWMPNGLRHPGAPNTDLVFSYFYFFRFRERACKRCRERES